MKTFSFIFAGSVSLTAVLAACSGDDAAVVSSSGGVSGEGGVASSASSSGHTGGSSSSGSSSSSSASSSSGSSSSSSSSSSGGVDAGDAGADAGEDLDSGVDAADAGNTLDAGADADAGGPTTTRECSGAGLDVDAEVTRIRVAANGSLFVLDRTTAKLHKYTVAAGDACALTPDATFVEPTDDVLAFDLDASGALYTITAGATAWTFTKRDPGTGAASVVECTFADGSFNEFGNLAVRPDGLKAFTLSSGSVGDGQLPGPYEFDITAASCTASEWKLDTTAACDPFNDGHATGQSLRGDATRAYVGCFEDVNGFGWSSTSRTLEASGKAIVTLTDLALTATSLDVASDDEIDRYDRSTGVYSKTIGLRAVFGSFIPDGPDVPFSYWLDAMTDPVGGKRYVSIDSGSRILRVDDF